MVAAATDVPGHTPVTFLGKRLVGPSGRRVDQRCPIVDPRLPDGSRLNVVARDYLFT